MHDLSELQRRAAGAFFGYYPTWQMFSHDLNTHRDERSKEEGWARTALDYLADVVGRTHTDLLGVYFSAQSGHATGAGALTALLRCYDDAHVAYFGTPSGAFPAN